MIQDLLLSPLFLTMFSPQTYYEEALVLILTLSFDDKQVSAKIMRFVAALCSSFLVIPHIWR